MFDFYQRIGVEGTKSCYIYQRKMLDNFLLSSVLNNMKLLQEGEKELSLLHRTSDLLNPRLAEEEPRRPDSKVELSSPPHGIRYGDTKATLHHHHHRKEGGTA